MVAAAPGRIVTGCEGPSSGIPEYDIINLLRYRADCRGAVGAPPAARKAWFPQEEAGILDMTGKGNLLQMAERTIRSERPSAQMTLHGISAATSENTLIETPNYFLEAFSFETTGPFVITFEHAGAPRFRPDGYRPGWGAPVLRKKAISHLSIKPKEVDWYRKPDLSDALAALKDNGFFARYDRVITYGGSMGGYAALAYAGTVGADTVIAMNPQSTLDRKLVPWEKRFVMLGQSQDWSDPRSDAANGCGQARKVYAVVDRRFAADWKHIIRLPAHNLHVLNIPYVEHSVPLHLANMRALGIFISDIILKDDLDETHFYRLMRNRRHLKRYYNVLKRHPRVQASPKFSAIVEKHCNDRMELGALK